MCFFSDSSYYWRASSLSSERVPNSLRNPQEPLHFMIRVLRNAQVQIFKLKILCNHCLFFLAHSSLPKWLSRHSQHLHGAEGMSLAWATVSMFFVTSQRGEFQTLSFFVHYLQEVVQSQNVPPWNCCFSLVLTDCHSWHRNFTLFGSNLWILMWPSIRHHSLKVLNPKGSHIQYADDSTNVAKSATQEAQKEHSKLRLLP